MQYLLLIYNSEKTWSGMSEADQGKAFGGYKQFSEDVKKSGNFKGGEALQPVASATTVRVRGGKIQTTDGPFAETREQLGGYYLIDAKDLDEATKIAAKIPDAAIGDGCVEIRPIMVFNQDM